MPWYMDHATTCIDCQISEGPGSELHRGLVLPREWGILVLGGRVRPGDLQLRFVIDNKLYHTSFIFSAEEIFSFREFDRRFGLEPLTTDGYKEIPPRRLIVVSNFTIIVKH